jgi:hypothetical protein
MRLQAVAPQPEGIGAIHRGSTLAHHSPPNS